MASNYTANYGLCQWAPENAFLREEFNQDNEKIDAALKAAEDKAEAETRRAQTAADRALAGLEDQSYNIYNLILQNDYEGKYTGYKKALLYDGFVDDEGIEARDTALILGGMRLCLDSTGQTSLTTAFGSSFSYTSTTSEVKSATRCGRLTGYAYRLNIQKTGTGTSSFTLSYVLKINGVTVLDDRETVRAENGEDTDLTLEFSAPFEVTPGDKLQITLEGNGSAFLFCQNTDKDALAGTFVIEPASGSTGTVTTAPQTLPDASGALAWARHGGGSVSLVLEDASGGLHALTAVGQRSATELNGKSCTETTYRLDEALTAGAWKLRLTLDRGEADIAYLYDYGLILLP